MLTFHSLISYLLLILIVNRNHLFYCHIKIVTTLFITIFFYHHWIIPKSTPPSLDLRSPLAVTCIPGMYQNEKSQVKCKLCALDHYSKVSKAIQCEKCPSGWSSKEGKFFCVACSAGKKVRDNIYRGKNFTRLFLLTNIFASSSSFTSSFFSSSIRLLPSRVMNASLEDTRMPQNKTNASYVLLVISNKWRINLFVSHVVLDYIKTKLKGKILLFDIKLKHL